MMYVRLAGCPYVVKKKKKKTLDVAIFSRTTNTINVKLCMMVAHIELYPFPTLSVKEKK